MTNTMSGDDIRVIRWSDRNGVRQEEVFVGDRGQAERRIRHLRRMHPGSGGFEQRSA